MSQRDEIRRAYLKCGPYQIQLENYTFSREKLPRRFQSNWFENFPSWIDPRLMMELIVWHVIYLVQSQMVLLGQICLLNKVLDHGKRLM